MLKKEEIISVLIDNGVSVLESEGLTDNKENFELAIQDIREKVLSDYSTIELSHRVIEEVVSEWVKEQDKPEPDMFGVPKIIIGDRQIQDLIKRLKEKKER